jgi:hypothetical protein
MWQADPISPSNPSEEQIEASAEKRPEEATCDREAIARLLDDGCPHGRDDE